MIFHFRLSRALFLFGILSAAVLLIVAFNLETFSTLIFIAAIIVFSIFFIAAQLFAAVLTLKEEERRREREMVVCPSCSAPIYEEDDVCPYCSHERS